MTEEGNVAEIEPEAEVLKALVELQEKTPCRKCKTSSWTLLPDRRDAAGGDKVGIYVVLGRGDERVAVVTFECKSCRVKWDRPCYSRAQLARQEFPAVKLDVRAGDDQPPGSKNGKAR